jgi:hypothetical protein
VLTSEDQVADEHRRDFVPRPDTEDHAESSYRRSNVVETKGIEPSTPALQRWPTAYPRASTSNNVPAGRHSVLTSVASSSRFVPRGVPRAIGTP